MLHVAVAAVTGDVKQFCERQGLTVSVVLERRAGRERLTVLKCRRSRRTTASDVCPFSE